MQRMFICEHIMNFRQNSGIHFPKTEKKTLENNFVAEYMLKKRSIHIF